MKRICNEGHVIAKHKKTCQTCRRIREVEEFRAKYCRPVEPRKPVPWGEPVHPIEPEIETPNEAMFRRKPWQQKK